MYIGKGSAKRTNRGFTLLEMSITLSVLALIAAAGLSAFSSKFEDNKRRSTYVKITAIMDAIQQYRDTNGYLPCPASATAGLAAAGFGVGTGSGSTGLNNCTAATTRVSLNFPGGVAQDEAIVIGAVPVGDLGLAPDFMLDGWGRRITYVVDEAFTYTAGFAAGAASTVTDGVTKHGTGVIRVLDEAGSSLTRMPDLLDEDNDTNVTETIEIGVPVLLISHGANGYGAYTVKGGGPLSPSAGGTFEDNNTATHDRAFSAVTFREAANPFDDILLWRTKWFLQHEKMEKLFGFSD